MWIKKCVELLLLFLFKIKNKNSKNTDQTKAIILLTLSNRPVTHSTFHSTDLLTCV